LYLKILCNLGKRAAIFRRFYFWKVSIFRNSMFYLKKNSKQIFEKKPGGIPFWGVSFPQEYKVHFDG
jgi:hypothetical protein